MRATITILLAVSAVALLMAQQTVERSGAPAFEYTKDGQLILPTNYREWVFLSSGLGMTYGPAAEANAARGPMFDNVFVNPAAHSYFLKNGTWPEKTMFVLEIRSATSKGSINNGGHYQNEMVAVEGEVKDTAKFGGSGWAFFAIGKGTSGKQIPSTAACYTCHPTKGAVDNTFVQFYPTLLPIAKAKGTLTSAYIAADSH
jgi:hypothetical protein